MTSHDRLHHLSEEVPGQLLLQNTLFGDEVEEVLARRGFLHHVDEGIVTLVEVQKANDAGNTLNLRQEFQL